MRSSAEQRRSTVGSSSSGSAAVAPSPRRVSFANNNSSTTSSTQQFNSVSNSPAHGVSRSSSGGGGMDNSGSKDDVLSNSSNDNYTNGKPRPLSISIPPNNFPGASPKAFSSGNSGSNSNSSGSSSNSWEVKRMVVKALVIVTCFVVSFNMYLLMNSSYSLQQWFQADKSILHDSDTALHLLKIPTIDTMEAFAKIPVLRRDLRALLDTYKAEILYSAKSNLFHLGDKLYKFSELQATQESLSSQDSKSYRFNLMEIDPCNAKTLLDVFDLAQNPIVNLSGLYPLTRPLSIQKLSVDPVAVDRSHTQTRSQVLIVYTTCNQLPTTIMSLQFLRNTDKLGDLLIIDDYSTDGTVEYLQKRGFAVITKPKATGLTDSWNIGYRIAVALGYKFVVFTNNDVLLTTGSVALMTRGLNQHALVVPLTTEKGAGHHPPQSISRAYNLLPAMSNYIDDYRNAEFIQEVILKKFIFVPPEQRRCPAELSKARGMPKFNGFCFSINVERMNPAAFEPNVHLFDPADIIVGQEDHLVKRMHEKNLVPIILHCAFVYHFKSITVSSANITSFALELQASHNITVQQIGPANSPIAKLTYVTPKTREIIEKEFDIREDLRWYHPEERENFLMDLFNISDGKLNIKSLAGREEEIEHQFAARASDLIGGESNSDRFRERVMKQCRPDTKEVLFPKQSLPIASRLESLYRQFPQMNWNIRANPYCVYPSQWQPHCDQYLSTNPDKVLKFEPELYAKSSSRYIVIAFAMSDPIRNPSAGDVFTAYELGSALIAQYSNVKVKYLRRDVNWYSPQALSDVDVLIPLLDQYDLTKTLSMFQDSTPPSYTKSATFQCLKKLQIKPSLVTIAWVRNWFHRWLTKPWIGNYDTILTTSSLTKAFYDTINNEMGLPVSCALSCPHKLAGYALKSLPRRFTSKNVDPDTFFLDSMIPTNESWHLFPTRAKTSIYIYPIATAIDYGSKNVSSSHKIIRGSSGIVGSSGKGLLSSTLPSAQTIPKYEGNGKDRESKQKQKQLLASPLLLEAETKRLFQGVDYIFTGSYFNVPRKIMNFDPDEIPKWQGRIVGGSWEKVKKQLTKGWNAICLGLLPYEMVKESYKYVKIVVDDANHVTAPWGSVNSRVFDALASGAMVVSNGEIGMRELFGPALKAQGLKLPLYSDGKELAKVLDHYLRNDDLRIKTARIMREVVFRSHTYRKRAVQLADLLGKKFGMKLNGKEGLHSSQSHYGKKHSHRDHEENEHEEGGEDNEGGEMSKKSSTTSGEEADIDAGEERRRYLLEEQDIEEILEQNDNEFSQKIDPQDSQFMQWSQTEREVVQEEDLEDEEDVEEWSGEREEDNEEIIHSVSKGRRQLSISAVNAPSAGQQSVVTPAVVSTPNTTTSTESTSIHRQVSYISPPPKVKNNVQFPQSVCIGVRTSKGQEEWIPVLMRSLIAQHVKSKYRNKLALQLFVVDTEANTEYTQFLIRQAEKLNAKFQFPYIQIVVAVQTTPSPPEAPEGQHHHQRSSKPAGHNKLYGYDDTDRLLELMLSMKECGSNGEVATTPATASLFSSSPSATSSGVLNETTHFNSFLIPSCEWVMFTNGDNMYNSAWLNTIGAFATATETKEEPVVVTQKVKDTQTNKMTDVVVSNTTRLVIDNAFDIIGWDFITHHPRGDKNDTPNQPIRISFERGFLDLGSVILRANLFAKINARFLPDAAFTKDLFARDYHTISRLLPLTTPERIKLVHQYLLLHQ